MASQDYYELFELEPSATIDTKQLRARYRSLQTQHHPDNFASQSDAVKLAAVQQTALINDAYATLTDPVKRARYLLTLRSHQQFTESNLASEPAFLMQQIEARETIENFVEEGGDYDQLMALIDEYQAQLNRYQGEFAAAIDANNWQGANILIAKMQLFSKLLQEASELEDQVD